MRAVATDTRADATIAIVGLTLAALLASGTAFAQDTGNRRAAAEAYDHGTASYLQHDFAAAANWFETADRLAPSALALQSAIRAHRESGGAEHFARAATLALRLRRLYPQDERAVQAADHTVEQLAPQLARINATCGTCDLEVDGVLQSSQEVFVTPGAHRVVAHWSGDRSVAQSPTLTAGATAPLVFAEPPAPTPTVAHETAVVAPAASPAASAAPGTSRGHASGLSPVVFVVGVALTLACGGVLVWSGLDANAQGNQLITEAMQTHVRDPALESNVQTAEIRTDVLAVGTGVLGAATIALAFVTRWHGNTERAVAIAPTVNSAGAALSVVGRF